MTRHERKMARKARFERMEQADAALKEQRELYAKAHPVSAGLIPVVDYQPPAGRYIVFSANTL